MLAFPINSNLRAVSSYMYRHTCIVIHVSSYMYRHTCIVIHVSSYMYRHTCIVIHVSSYMYRHTCIVIHVSSYMYRHTCIVIHVSSYMYHHTCIVIHVSSYMFAERVERGIFRIIGQYCRYTVLQRQEIASCQPHETLVWSLDQERYCLDCNVSKIINVEAETNEVFN